MKKIALIIMLLVTTPYCSFAQDLKLSEADLRKLAISLSELDQKINEIYQARQYILTPQNSSSVSVTEVEIKDEKTTIWNGITPGAKGIITGEKGEKYPVVGYNSNHYAILLEQPSGEKRLGWIETDSVNPVIKNESKEYLFVKAGIPTPANLASIEDPELSELLIQARAETNLSLRSSIIKTISDRLHQQLIDSVQKIKQEYSQNNFAEATGFVVQLGLSPSISVTFTFK
ncbi:hypothetical protein [Desulfobacula toluolica]|uniref:Uncharacterized protein n=1 Tax=Desulfobacula toluolica (strain DSM 7467 / Tol2) TaxID=651182 RepID=K0NIJ9_DESTT|nr:hypothetical protein [Desulfobacula toluolica]CCK80765.1 uncharacterized protein TOL2_C26060 [Desulfobacula toluolica Tol2]